MRAEAQHACPRFCNRLRSTTHSQSNASTCSSTTADPRVHPWPSAPEASPSPLALACCGFRPSSSWPSHSSSSSSFLCFFSAGAEAGQRHSGRVDAPAEQWRGGRPSGTRPRSLQPRALPLAPLLPPLLTVLGRVGRLHLRHGAASDGLASARRQGRGQPPGGHHLPAADHPAAAARQGELGCHVGPSALRVGVVGRPVHAASPSVDHVSPDAPQLRRCPHPHPQVAGCSQRSACGRPTTPTPHTLHPTMPSARMVAGPGDASMLSRGAAVGLGGCTCADAPAPPPPAGHCCCPWRPACSHPHSPSIQPIPLYQVQCVTQRDKTYSRGVASLLGGLLVQARNRVCDACGGRSEVACRAQRWVGVESERRPQATRSCHIKRASCSQQAAEVPCSPAGSPCCHALHATRSHSPRPKAPSCASSPPRSVDSPVPCSSDGAHQWIWSAHGIHTGGCRCPMLSMHMQRRPVVRHELHDSPTTGGRQNSPYLEAQHDAHTQNVSKLQPGGGWPCWEPKPGLGAAACRRGGGASRTIHLAAHC